MYGVNVHHKIMDKSPFPNARPGACCFNSAVRVRVFSSFCFHFDDLLNYLVGNIFVLFFLL